MIQRFALTAGEPAGIGPDLCIALAQQAQSHEVVVIADPALLQQRAEQLQQSIELRQVDWNSAPQASPAGVLTYLPVPLVAQAVAGQLNVANAGYVTETLTQALQGCLQQRFAGLITAPVHKGIINDAGISFSGHTEFFAEGAGVAKVVMMLATPQLKVALATTHLPLRQVSDAINATELRQIIEIIDHSLRQQFGIAQPRIAVCGLNPHAGEGGHLGHEEQTIIEPVIRQLQQRGLHVSGAWPADTIFVADKLDCYDVVLAMYHDQGLPVLKHQGFGQAVNITLGLPFIRTSVDHGTALELAGTGKAHVGSLQAALAMAISIVEQSGSQS